MTDGVFEKKIKITDDMVNGDGTMTLLAMGASMQAAAGDQLDSLGIGYKGISNNGMLWVIVWSAFEITNLPRLGDEILIKTWPGKRAHWFFPRRYIMENEAGEELVRAGNMWMLIDCVTRKATPGNHCTDRLPQVVIDGEHELPPSRFPFPEGEDGRIYRCVTEDEVDSNKHLNNAHYLDWVNEAVTASGKTIDNISYLWINYQKEILPDQECIISYKYEEGSLYIKGGPVESDDNPGANKEHFLVKINFR